MEGIGSRALKIFPIPPEADFTPCSELNVQYFWRHVTFFFPGFSSPPFQMILATRLLCVLSVDLTVVPRIGFMISLMLNIQN